MAWWVVAWRGVAVAVAVTWPLPCGNGRTATTFSRGGSIYRSRSVAKRLCVDRHGRMSSGSGSGGSPQGARVPADLSGTWRTVAERMDTKGRATNEPGGAVEHSVAGDGRCGATTS